MSRLTEVSAYETADAMRDFHPWGFWNVSCDKLITVDANRINQEKIKISLKQNGMNKENLASLINIRENGNAKNHSLDDFVVSISSCLLPELGIKIEIEKTLVEFTFHGSMGSESKRSWRN